MRRDEVSYIDGWIEDILKTLYKGLALSRNFTKMWPLKEKSSHQELLWVFKVLKGFVRTSSFGTLYNCIEIK
jgi:hypothetical protein